MGYSPWGHKELDMSEETQHTCTHTQSITIWKHQHVPVYIWRFSKNLVKPQSNTDLYSGLSILEFSICPYQSSQFLHLFTLSSRFLKKVSSLWLISFQAKIKFHWLSPAKPQRTRMFNFALFFTIIQSAGSCGN